jgi:hypothetical protein
MSSASQALRRRPTALMRRFKASMRSSVEGSRATQTQNAARATLPTDPRDIDNRLKSGDLQVSALYNFDIQPAMARPISSGESS